MIWSVRSALLLWSTSCWLFPLASPPTKTWSGWWPTRRTGWCTPEPPSSAWTRTPRYPSPSVMRTWRGCSSPRRRSESHAHIAWRCEPSRTARTEASSTRWPSLSTLPSPLTLTESTLKDTGQRWGCGIKEWFWKSFHIRKWTEKQTLTSVQEHRGHQGSPEVNQRPGWSLTFDIFATTLLFIEAKNIFLLEPKQPNWLAQIGFHSSQIVFWFKFTWNFFFFNLLGVAWTNSSSCLC